jgi:folate-binding protein YgfZ
MSGTLLKITDTGDSAETRSVAEQFRALTTGCGVYELGSQGKSSQANISRTKIKLTGEDRTRWLNGMVTNNIRDLGVNRGVYCFLLNAQGRIQADLYAYNLGDSILVDADAEQREKILAHFDKYIIADDVEVSDVSATIAAIGISGPTAGEVLRKAGIQVPELAALDVCTPKCECDCDCVECTVVRADEASGSGYEIWLAPKQQKATWDALVAAGASVVGVEAIELRRVSLGVPRVGVDIRERELPQETGQMRALSFTKGCYLGQEIVERIRSRGAVHRQFGRFSVEGELPEHGTKIVADGKEVGEVTSGGILPLPTGDRAIALGYLRREAVGKELRAGSAKLIPMAMPVVWRES